MFDGWPVGVAHLSDQGVFLDVNDTFCRTVGHPRAYLLAHDFQSITHPEDLDLSINAVAAVRSGRVRHQRYEKRFVRSDGTPVWCDVTSTVRRKPNGAFDHLVAVISDISGRKAGEAELRRHREHLARAQRIAHVGSTELDLRTGKFRWSDEFCRMFGFDPTTTRPGLETYLTVIPPEDHARAREVVARLMKGMDIEPFELRIVRPDGMERWFHRDTETIRTADGVATHVISTFQDITERKKSADELKQTRAFLDLVIDNLPGTLVVKDAKDLRYRLWNRGSEEMMGIDRAEVIGKTDYDIVPKEQADFFAAVDRETLNSGKMTVVPEEPVDTRHRGTRIIQIKKVPVLDDAGQPSFLVSFAEDITERKRMEVELRKSQEHLARAQRVASIGSVEVDFKTGATIWSEELWRIYGLDPASEPPSFEFLISVTHPDDREALRDVHVRSLRGLDVEPLRLRIRLPGGQWRWIDRQVDIVRDREGIPVSMLVTNRDVTARQKIEEELRRSTEQLTALIEASPYAIIGLNPDRTVGIWNRQAEEIFERTADEALGNRFLDLLGPTPEDRAGYEKIYADVLSGTVVRGVGAKLRRQDGGTTLLSASASSFYGADGSQLGVVLVVEDVTKRSALEAQLRQAQKMEAIGNLTGGIAHDFNNILAVVIGNLDLLALEMPEGSEHRALVDTAVEASLKGSELTKSLLAFSRRQPLQPRLIDLNDTLAQSVKMLSRTIGENIRIELKPGASLWKTNADPALLESALLNMIVNSRDAMPHGGRIIVETGNTRLDEEYAAQNPEAMPGEYVLLSVTDTGTGMPPEVAMRVFEPFFTTKGVGKGTGLGLAMVFGFVKQSGGHIKIYSEVGHGTTIRIYLRKAVADDVAADDDAVRKAPPASARDELILIVEDNPSVRRAATKQLSGAGYRVLEAEDAASAIKVLEVRDRVDLVFSDVIMPGMLTGGDLAREVTRRWPGTKVLLTSGFPQGLLQDGNKLPGDVRLLSKPYRMDDLLRKVREVLDG